MFLLDPVPKTGPSVALMLPVVSATHVPGLMEAARSLSTVAEPTDGIRKKSTGKRRTRVLGKDFIGFSLLL
jgi:hypothetical protein